MGGSRCQMACFLLALHHPPPREAGHAPAQRAGASDHPDRCALWLHPDRLVVGGHRRAALRRPLHSADIPVCVRLAGGLLDLRRHIPARVWAGAQARRQAVTAINILAIIATGAVVLVVRLFRNPDWGFAASGFVGTLTYILALAALIMAAQWLDHGLGGRQ